MLNKIDDKCETTVPFEGDTEQSVLTVVEPQKAANDGRYRRRRLGRNLRAGRLAVGGWRITIGFRF